MLPLSRDELLLIGWMRCPSFHGPSLATLRCMLKEKGDTIYHDPIVVRSVSVPVLLQPSSHGEIKDVC